MLAETASVRLVDLPANEGRRLLAERAPRVLAELDAEAGGFDVVLLRGYRLCLETARHGALDGRLWCYLTDFPQDPTPSPTNASASCGRSPAPHGSCSAKQTRCARTSRRTSMRYMARPRCCRQSCQTRARSYRRRSTGPTGRGSSTQEVHPSVAHGGDRRVDAGGAARAARRRAARCRGQDPRRERRRCLRRPHAEPRSTTPRAFTGSEGFRGMRCSG